MTVVLLVFVGGTVGAPTRYLVDRWISGRYGKNFPLGTLAVNLVGCLVLGIVVGGVAHHGWSPNTQALLGTGFCGGLTTYSTFAVESVELATHRFRALPALYVCSSVACGIGLAEFGWLLT